MLADERGKADSSRLHELEEELARLRRDGTTAAPAAPAALPLPAPLPLREVTLSSAAPSLIPSSILPTSSNANTTQSLVTADVASGASTLHANSPPLISTSAQSDILSLHLSKLLRLADEAISHS
jgi:hypothetical protein